MNLHWGKTLEHKWVKVKNRPLNYTIYNQYNYTEYKLTAHKYYWSEQLASTSNRTGNQSALYAENQFLKKSKIMTDLVNPSVRSQSFTTVVVIASIFLFLTMTITAAVVVFCRKRNSVFAFQKSEQEDVADYELDDINTDVEYTETEFESETESIRPRKSLSHTSGASSTASGCGGSGGGGSGAGPSGYGAGSGAGGGVESDFENSPARRPLVAGLQHESEAEDSPVRRQHTCRCGGSADPRGQYQRMVVTAVLEKPQHPSPLHGATSDDESGVEAVRTRYIQKLDPRLYYSGFDGDTDILAAAAAAGNGKPPIINITYADDPPAYDSLDYYHHEQHTRHKHTVTADVENFIPATHFPLPPPLPPLPLSQPLPEAATSRADVHYENLPCRDSQVQTEKSAFPPDAAVVFVELPPKEKDPVWPQVEYVDLPPKIDPSPDTAPVHAPVHFPVPSPVPPPPAPPNPRSVPTTPTTPLAPPSTPTGGVIGIGLGVMGVVSMSPADEEEEDEEVGYPITTSELPRRYLPSYSSLQTVVPNNPNQKYPNPTTLKTGSPCTQQQSKPD